MLLQFNHTKNLRNIYIFKSLKLDVWLNSHNLSIIYIFCKFLFLQIPISTIKTRHHGSLRRHHNNIWLFDEHFDISIVELLQKQEHDNCVRPKSSVVRGESLPQTE